MTELTAWSIADHVERFAPTAQDVIVSGGGTHNTVLMERLAALMPTRSVVASDAIGLSSDAKEAMCFAWLAWRTLAGKPGNMPAVTGADREVVLGVVARPA
jgi:anhydro-N-acetylmuramic acid kinase